MKYYNKLKAMESISKYDMLNDWQLTFGDYYIELLREDLETKRITILFSNQKVVISFKNLECLDKNKLHELYLLTVELEDCVVK